MKTQNYSKLNRNTKEKQMKALRQDRGNATALVAGLGILTALSVVGLLKFTMVMGGTKETQNATEAGALNMADKSVNSIKVEPQDADEKQFSDVLDSQGKVGLSNINRVWAKALLANINVSAMNSFREGSGLAGQHAQQLFDAAQRLSDRLADKLNDPSQRYQFFNDLSERNVVSMAGMGTGAPAVQDPKQWKTSLLDRKMESNVIVSKDQIPPGFEFSQLQTRNVEGTELLRGYTPITVLDRKICFVPFKGGERTQLVSAENFEKNTILSKPLDAWKKPVPNAFSTAGKAKDGSFLGTAYVLANPQRSFKMSMPNSFVRIRLEMNEAFCSIGKEMPEMLTYDYGTELRYLAPKTEVSVNTETGAPSTTNVMGIFNLGTEYGDKCSLKKALFVHKHENVLVQLLQRVREIKPDYTREELMQLLDGQRARAGDYIICAESSAPDAKLIVAPANLVGTVNKAVNVNGQPDGRLHTIADESFSMIQSIEAIPYEIPLTLGVPMPMINFEFNEGELKWQPGSGFDGCLGTLKVQRKTTVLDHCVVLVPGG